MTFELFTTSDLKKIKRIHEFAFFLQFRRNSPEIRIIIKIKINETQIDIVDFYHSLILNGKEVKVFLYILF